MNIIQKLILKDHPDFDFNRYRFQLGDVTVCLDTGDTVLVIESAINYIECIVIGGVRPTCKGRIKKVYYDRLPFYTTGSYVRPNYEITKHLTLRSGDITTDTSGNVFCVLKRHNEDITILALGDNKEYGIHAGARYIINDGYIVQ